MAAHQLNDTTFLVTCAAGREQEAKGELRAALPGAHVRRMILKGNLLLTCDDEYDAAIERLRGQRTETIGRIAPVYVECPVEPVRESVQRLAEASDLLTGPTADATFRVRCRRRGQHGWSSRDVERAVGERVVERTGAPVDLDAPRQIVSVDVFQDTAYLGAARAERIINKTITKDRIWAPGERPLNRSELKLREIIEQFDLQLPADGAALDLGAAPGGWTKVLAEHMAHVTAVDPADLDDGVSGLPNVRHLRIHAEQLLEMPEIGPFDVIANDMNMDPDESARIVCDTSRILRPGATMVMTVKFVTRRRSEHVRAALDILKARFNDLQVRRMPHNAMETTVVGRFPDI